MVGGECGVSIGMRGEYLCMRCEGSESQSGFVTQLRGRRCRVMRTVTSCEADKATLRQGFRRHRRRLCRHITLDHNCCDEAV